ncbi:MAG: PilZ domain-containing protein [Acidobacteria bacterium]|nr:PilZ domain-containing protein [Acidobacteriota bacterium]
MADAGAPESERRRTERVYFEPLRVRVRGAREGILVDLSESGALALFQAALRVGETIKLQIEWKDQVLPVAARVQRCVAHPVQLPSATLARTQYDVAVEFVDLSPDTAATIRQILQGNLSR